MGMRWRNIRRLRHDAVNLQPKGETKMGEKIKLGDLVTDSVTGVIGTATARIEYLHGESQVLIEYQADGRACEKWITESRAAGV